MNIRHRDKLRLTYPLTIHFKWMVDLVSMPMGVGQMKYLVLGVGRLSVRKGSYNNLFVRKNLHMGDMKERNMHREREREA